VRGVAVAIGLKIPDNAAYTAQVTLQRMGIAVAGVERTDILLFDDGDPAERRRQVAADESLFNPNKHRLIAVDAPTPRSGEVWIAELEDAPRSPRRITGWRLFDERGEPAPRAVVQSAVEALLCNPAIERATY
jgi:phosphoribosylformylglycinamidine (FGAM) synthase PurS component